MINKFIRAIAAGLMIGIAGSVYLAVGPPLGAILFSLGLILICTRGYNLYTGKIGYIKNPKEIIDMLVYIGGNAIGTACVALMQPFDTAEMMAAKFAQPWYLILLKAVGCGILMYIAVDIYKNSKSYWGIITCIPAFILAGFEHSIADMFYAFCMPKWENIPKMALFFGLVILGNAIGANLHWYLKIGGSISTTGTE